MRLEWIEDILAVIDFGSFSAAAQARYLTPSAFTRRIRSIEESLGTPLFDRDRKPVMLLPHLAVLETDLRVCADQLRRLKSGLSDPSAGELDEVSLMCQHALAAAVAPALVSLMAGGAEMKIAMRDGTRTECTFALLQREIDFALVYENPEEDMAAEIGYLNSLTLGTEVFAPVACLDRNPQLVDRIATGPIPTIGYPDSIYLGEVLHRKIFPRLAAGTEIQTIAESGLTLAIAEFVRRGLGVAWLPLTVVARELEAGEMQIIDHLPSCELKVNLMILSGNRSRRSVGYWQTINDHVAAGPGPRGSIRDFVRNGD